MNIQSATGQPIAVKITQKNIDDANKARKEGLADRRKCNPLIFALLDLPNVESAEMSPDNTEVIIRYKDQC